MFLESFRTSLRNSVDSAIAIYLGLLVKLMLGGMTLHAMCWMSWTCSSYICLYFVFYCGDSSTITMPHQVSLCADGRSCRHGNHERSSRGGGGKTLEKEFNFNFSPYKYYDVSDMYFIL